MNITRTRRDQGLLAGIAAMALLLGLLVYSSARDPARVALMPTLAALAPFRDLAGFIRWGTAGQWLPSFVHCLAFGLLTAVALPPRQVWQLGGCAAWAVIDALFELGQLPALAAAWQRVFGSSLVSDYFARGTFDPADIVATLAGAGVAMLLVYLVNQSEPGDVHTPS